MVALVFITPVFSQPAFAHEGEQDSKTVEIEKKPPVAHADHKPKHGGQFFMAPNRWNHLEGTMAGSRDFRLYFYDNYTKPILAQPFREKTTIEVETVDQNGRSIGTASKLDVRSENNGKYLVASLPPGIAFPLYFTVKIQFPKQSEADLFNFTFDQSSGMGDVAPMNNPKIGEKTTDLYQCPMKDLPAQSKPGKCPKCGMELQRTGT